MRNEPKRTTFTSSGFGLLQMVLELEVERCTSKDVRDLNGVDCEIPHRLEMGTMHFSQGCRNLSQTDAF